MLARLQVANAPIVMAPEIVYVDDGVSGQDPYCVVLDTPLAFITMVGVLIASGQTEIPMALFNQVSTISSHHIISSHLISSSNLISSSHRIVPSYDDRSPTGPGHRHARHPRLLRQGGLLWVNITSCHRVGSCSTLIRPCRCAPG